MWYDIDRCDIESSDHDILLFTKYVIMSLIYVHIDTAWLKFLMKENIDEITKFLLNCQNFPYQTFLLAIANLVLASFINTSFVKFSQCQYVNIFPCKVHSILYYIAKYQ